MSKSSKIEIEHGENWRKRENGVAKSGERENEAWRGQPSMWRGKSKIKWRCSENRSSMVMKMAAGENKKASIWRKLAYQ
jgi:hypothetical protein